MGVNQQAPLPAASSEASTLPVPPAGEEGGTASANSAQQIKRAEVDFGAGQPASAYVRECPGDLPMVARDIGLARLIPLNFKERVWRKEYIDIFSLLEVSAAEEDKQKRQVRVERNLANWGHAFRTMASIIVEKFPECAGALFLYEQNNPCSPR